MRITCPLCGFGGGSAETLPSDSQRATGAMRQAVDLVGTLDRLEAKPGEIAVCPSCATAVIFAGWVPLVEDTMKALSPLDRAMIQKTVSDAQEAIKHRKVQGKDQQKKRGN